MLLFVILPLKGHFLKVFNEKDRTHDTSNYPSLLEPHMDVKRPGLFCKHV